MTENQKQKLRKIMCDALGSTCTWCPYDFSAGHNDYCDNIADSLSEREAAEYVRTILDRIVDDKKVVEVRKKVEKLFQSEVK